MAGPLQASRPSSALVTSALSQVTAIVLWTVLCWACFLRGQAVLCLWRSTDCRRLCLLAAPCRAALGPPVPAPSSSSSPQGGVRPGSAVDVLLLFAISKNLREGARNCLHLFISDFQCARSSAGISGGWGSPCCSVGPVLADCCCLGADTVPASPRGRCLTGLCFFFCLYYFPSPPCFLTTAISRCWGCCFKSYQTVMSSLWFWRACLCRSRKHCRR